MSAPAKAPKTIEELQIALRLKQKSDAEALVKTDDVKEAYRKYANRCLSSGSTRQELPGWDEVDQYLMDTRLSGRLGRRQTLEDVVAEDSYNRPHELLPHASLFALRIMAFLKSRKGRQYDVGPGTRRVGADEDLQFDRCVRIMALLAFLVHQSRESKRQREVAAMREAMQVVIE
ncbi:hypothetical protein GGR54DRAFT_653714 [Hypoxylon sp. NC1633]|nr:hypothetical protein GGR54DRAFT_653714 [Hypoxylon sp. NC1633]